MLGADGWEGPGLEPHVSRVIHGLAYHERCMQDIGFLKYHVVS